MLLSSGIDSLLISNPVNIRYLTGFVGASPEEREAYILLTQQFSYLFINTLYLESAKNAKCPMPNTKFKIIEISREKPLSKELARILREEKIKRLGFEEANLTVAEYTKFTQTLKGITLVPTRDRIEKIRIIKRDDEIKNIRAAAKMTDACFDFILGKIKPHVSESEIAWEIESFFRKRGAQSAFSPIVAFGKNSSQPHYLTSDIRLNTSDIILLDFGARVNGYCSDMTRMVFIGKPKEEWKKAYVTVANAQTVALDTIHNNPDKHAREVIQNAGFPAYPHSLGHGVGLSIHEQPRLSYKNPSVKASTVSSAEPLKAGMVITVEPGIYVEGSYGIRIEDLVLLKKEGIEILSKSPKQLIIL